MIPKPTARVRVRKPLRRSSEPVKRSKRPRKVRKTSAGAKARTADRRGTVAKRRAARKRLRDAADAKWRGEVRWWAGGACERTGYPGTDCHHIWPKGAHPRLRHDVDNGILLTHEEHLRAHRDMTRFRAWVASMFPQRWYRLEAARLD